MGIYLCLNCQYAGGHQSDCQVRGCGQDDGCDDSTTNGGSGGGGGGCSPLNMVLQMAALLVSVRLLGSTLMVSYCGAALSNV